MVFDAFPAPFRLLFPIKGSSSHSKSSKSSSWSSSFFFAATLFLLVPAAGKVVLFFFFCFCASFFSPPKHLGDEDASTTILAVILDGLESGISGVIAFLFVLSSCSFSLLFVLVRSFNLLLFFVVVKVVRRIFREDILKMFLKNDFKQTRESKSHRRSVREDEKKKKESLILLVVVVVVVEVYCVFAKRRRTGVVRLFYVLVSLVFVGGGCVDMKVRKLSLAFFARALFQKKKSVKI